MKQQNISILHNPRCGKSRGVLQALIEQGYHLTVIEYLKNPLSEKVIADICHLLKLPPSAIIRKKETVYSSEYKDKKMTESDYLKALASHAILIERPIVFTDKKAWLVRTEEALDNLLTELS